jgi:predicted phosphodiesterase
MDDAERMTAASVAVLNDIHGNLPALEAVLVELVALAPDCIVVGGDVAAGPFPRETLDRLMGLAASGVPVCFVRGNADREMVERFDQLVSERDTYAAEGDPSGLTWLARQITPVQRDFLAGFSDIVTIDVTMLGRALFCHGSPRSDEEIITSVTSEERLAGILADVAEPVIVCGHTHVQFDRRLGRQRVVNAGSVGMPYEGRPGACWALLGPDVQLRRTAYDVPAAAALVERSAYPDAETFAGRYLLNPPQAAEASAFFERMALEREAGA